MSGPGEQSPRSQEVLLLWTCVILHVHHALPSVLPAVPLHLARSPAAPPVDPVHPHHDVLLHWSVPGVRPQTPPHRCPGWVLSGRPSSLLHCLLCVRLVSAQRKTLHSVPNTGEERAPSCSRHKGAGQSSHNGVKSRAATWLQANREQRWASYSSTATSSWR